MGVYQIQKHSITIGKLIPMLRRMTAFSPGVVYSSGFERKIVREAGINSADTVTATLRGRLRCVEISSVSASGTTDRELQETDEGPIGSKCAPASEASLRNSRSVT